MIVRVRSIQRESINIDSQHVTSVERIATNHMTYTFIITESIQSYFKYHTHSLFFTSM